MIRPASKSVQSVRPIYAMFAELFAYPTEQTGETVQECIDALLDHAGYPKDAAREMKKFQAAIAELSLDDLQGVYSYTFELAADYTLDLGHHLYDGFKRSGTLLSIKMMYKRHGFQFDEVAKGELPDNLVFVLRFLSTLDDGNPVKKDFREDFVIKAMEKLAKSFELKGQDNIYSHLVKALYVVIDKDVKVS